jgi:hypothetical protein
MSKPSIIFFFGITIIFLGCKPSSSPESYKELAANPYRLHEAVDRVVEEVVYDIFPPTTAARIYSYACIAGYEVMVHDNPGYYSLVGQLNGFTGPVPKPEEGKEYCYPLAANIAICNIGKKMTFREDSIAAFVERMVMKYKAMGISEEVITRSIDFGNKTSDVIVAWASKDNYAQTRSMPKFTVDVKDPSRWRPTPPALSDALEPNWKFMRPHVMDSASQFKPERPTPFSLDKKSKFYAEAMEVYNIIKNITPEQKSDAIFWDDNAMAVNISGHVMGSTKKISPSGHWVKITGQACRKSNLDFMKSLEAYLLVCIAEYDGFISCWDEKYRSNLVRPETYINEYIDKDWLPILQTPPFPEYTSGHSVVTGASSVILTDIFGEEYTFVDSTEVKFGLEARTFKSFYQAAEQCAFSRQFGGIHYRPAVVNGATQGKAIGKHILTKLKIRRTSAVG